MPMALALVGSTTDQIVHEVTARWTMAHAASVGAFDPCYLDTSSPAGVVAVPMFPVCVEWPAVQAALGLATEAGLTRDEARRSVHATHDLTVHRLVRPGDVLTTTGTVTVVEARRPGAYQEVRLDTVDAEGLPVATTLMGSLFRGTTTDPFTEVGEVGVPAPPGDGSAAPPAEGSTTGPRLLGRVLELDAGLAHAYSEGSRIWNPIHTDVAVAQKAGLAEPILHGTATLTLAVQQLVDTFAAGDPHAVRRITCRFSGMVPLPSSITVRAFSRTPLADGSYRITFDVADPHARPLLRAATLTLGTP